MSSVKKVGSAVGVFLAVATLTAVFQNCGGAPTSFNSESASLNQSNSEELVVTQPPVATATPKVIATPGPSPVVQVPPSTPTPTPISDEERLRLSCLRENGDNCHYCVYEYTNTEQGPYFNTRQRESFFVNDIQWPNWASSCLGYARDKSARMNHQQIDVYYVDGADIRGRYGFSTNLMDDLTGVDPSGTPRIDRAYPIIKGNFSPYATVSQ